MGGQRRKKGSRVTPKGGAPGSLTPHERARLEDVFEAILRSAPRDLPDDLSPVVAEIWASQLWSIWANSELEGMDAIEVLAGGLIGYAGVLGTSGALMALRALASIAPPPYGERSRRRGRPAGGQRSERTLLGSAGGVVGGDCGLALFRPGR